jgi:hypothetical protein
MTPSKDVGESAPPETASDASTDSQEVDLIEVSGRSWGQRALPLLGGIALLIVVIAILRTRRR